MSHDFEARSSWTGPDPTPLCARCGEPPPDHDDYEKVRRFAWASIKRLIWKRRKPIDYPRIVLDE